MQTCKFFYWFILKQQLMINATDKNNKKCKNCYQKIGSCVCYNKIRCCLIDVGDIDITTCLIKSPYQINFCKKIIYWERKIS